MKKYCYIRQPEANTCPFGLPITLACKHAGDSVTHMCPLKILPEEKHEAVEKANKRVYIYYKTDNRCIYAVNILEEHEAVNCNFGDTAAGMNTPAFSGSPLYPQTFSGIGLDGLYAFPLGFYADNNESRNLFQGLFSLVGNKTYNLIKNGSLSKELLERISNNEPLTKDEQFELISAVENCREKYEENMSDPGIINKMIDKWNPRKRL